MPPFVTLEQSAEAPTEADEEDFKQPWLRSRVLRDSLRHWSLMTGVAVLAVLVIVAVSAPLIARYDPDSINVFTLNYPPSGAHWFGTDYLGRDLWARVVYGGRISLRAGLGVVALAAGIGVPIGIVAGHVGGWIDDVLMRMMDILLSFPGLILAIGVIGILSPGLGSAIIAIGITSIPYYARFVRGGTLAVKEMDFVAAAHALGVSHRRVISHHILPNILGPVVVLTASNFGYAILATAGLSYLGLGSQPPTSDWGVLLSQGYQYLYLSPTEILFPGVAIVSVVLAVNLIADGLGDVLSRRA
jgi:peptide/nickel transport system permease protein